jgi:sulfotransferase
MPRSGSTLLCNILAQNPKFFVSPATSGCHDVLFNIRNQWDRLIEHQAEGVDYERLRSVLRAVLDSYHGTEKEIVIDKGRGWLSLIEMVQFITNEPPKIIVPVRDVAEILASFEQLWRKSTGQSQWMFESSDYFKSQTLEGRCDIWASQEQPVGLAYNRVKDAISRGHSKLLLFVEMDNLTTYPEKTLQKIYNFLEEPLFNHDFKNVQQYTKEDDLGIHRIPELHSVRPVVAPVPHRALEILGSALKNKYSGTEVWRNVTNIG